MPLDIMLDLAGARRAVGDGGAAVKTTHTSEFTFGDRVSIDGDDTLRGLIIAVIFHRDRPAEYEVSWFASGDAKTAWIEEWRLILVER